MTPAQRIRFWIAVAILAVTLLFGMTSNAERRTPPESPAVEATYVPQTAGPAVVIPGGLPRG